MAQIGVKEAVKAAKEALLELYEDDPPTALALEEIEQTEENGRGLWAVTLGFLRDHAMAGANNHLGALFTPSPSHVEQRVYKTLFIDAATGSFVKMDIRQVQ